MRWRLLDPGARELYVNWDAATQNVVSGLREVAVSDLDDPRLRALIDELSAARASKLRAPEEIRTPNLLIRSQMLYPLSYGRLFSCLSGGERI